MIGALSLDSGGLEFFRFDRNGILFYSEKIIAEQLPPNVRSACSCFGIQLAVLPGWHTLDFTKCLVEIRLRRETDTEPD